MDIRQLEYFAAVADASTFTAAAGRVHTTQPNISAQIRSLERELGAALFDRSGRQVSLTGAGEAALPAAREVLAAAESVRQAVADVNQVLRGRLSVGMVDGCTVRPLFAALGAFGTHHPGITVRLTEDASDRLIDRVRRGDLDVALTGYGHAAPDGLEELPIIRERVIAVVPHHHRLASKTSVTQQDLATSTVIGLPRGAGIRTVFDRGAPDVATSMEASSPDAVIELVAAGLGVGVLSESIAADRAERVTGRPIRGVDDLASLGFLWRRPASPAVRAFLRDARDQLGHDTP